MLYGLVDGSTIRFFFLTVGEELYIWKKRRTYNARPSSEAE